jgi:hypothetical protein
MIMKKKKKKKMMMMMMKLNWNLALKKAHLASFSTKSSLVGLFPTSKTWIENQEEKKEEKKWEEKDDA